MPDFSFDAIKVTVTKPADLPKVERPRALAAPKPNPFDAHYVATVKKTGDDGKGQWLNVTLPGKEGTVTGKNGNVRKTYGETVEKAQSLLIAASKAYSKAYDVNLSVSFRRVDNGDGTVTLHFQSIPRGTRTTKTAEDK